MQRHRIARYLVVMTSLCGATSLARAQAFGLNEIGSCAFARGFAVTSAPCSDASTIFWNPGFAAGMKGNSILAGAAVINIAAKFTRDSGLGEHKADVPLQIVPHFFLNHAADNMAFGIGVYVPYGLTSQWKDDFPGRFLAKKVSIKTIYVQPNFAMSFNDGKLLVGGGPVWAHSSVELNQAIDLADQIASVNTATTPPTVIRWRQLGIARRTQFAHAALTGAANGIGLNLGVLAKVSDDWTFGLRYLSSILMQYKDADAVFGQDSTGIVFAANNPLGLPAGTRFDTLLSVRQRFCSAAGVGTPSPFGGGAATCAAAGPLASQKGQTQVAHPDQLQFGFAYRGVKDWLIAVDYDWAGWRKFKELPLTFTDTTINRVQIEDYNNTSAIRIGVERTMENGWHLRFGFSGVASAAPDETVTPLIPEQDRMYLAIGAGIPLIQDRVTLDAAYGYITEGGRRGRIDDRFSRAQLAATLNTGRYDLHAHVVSLTLTSNF